MKKCDQPLPLETLDKDHEDEDDLNSEEGRWNDAEKGFGDTDCVEETVDKESTQLSADTTAIRVEPLARKRRRN